MFEWDPFEEFDKIEKKMRDSFRRMFEEVGEEFSTVQGMPFEMKEREDEIVIRAELPGFSKEDVGVRLTEDSVEIAAHKRQEKREQTKKIFRAEQSMNSVRRVMSLPQQIDSKNAKVDFVNGILTITAPKKVSRRVKKEIRAR